MNKLWIIWAVVLIVAGAAGLVYVGLDRYAEQMRLQPYRERFSDTRDEYLAAYEQWSKLPPDVKAENPWGQGAYGGDKTTEQIAKEQPARLKADLLDLARGVKTPHPLADILYGPDWRQKVAEYRGRLALRENITIAATIALAAGAIGLLGLTSRWLVGRLAHGAKAHESKAQARQAETEARSAGAVGPDRFVDVAARQRSPLRARRTDAPTDDRDDNAESVGYFEAARLKDMTKTTADPAETGQVASAGSRTPDKAGDSSDRSAEQPAEPATAKQDQRPNGPRPKTATGDTDAPPRTRVHTAVPAAQRPITAASLAGQFQPSGQFTNVATLMSTDPVGVRDSLSELTQEMSAIRQFAAQQQDHVRRLQEGYDWNIIKRFCMRVIRCVDNLDSRIAKLAEQNHDVSLLEDVRDELVFALESSGVEQFEPELDSPYKGKEKSVEAVRARVKTSDPERKGKIAEIVRPGYQYVVSDDDVRVVRCAQVKLYA